MAVSKIINKVVLVITDGLGYSLDCQNRIAADVLKNSEIMGIIQEYVHKATVKHTNIKTSPETLANAALFPIYAETISKKMDATQAKLLLKCLNEVKLQLKENGIYRDKIMPLLRKHAQKSRYVPWIAINPAVADFRNEHLTIPTFASGKWVGFEDVTPEVSGNSETGHQQIGSLAMVPQISLAITQSIEDGTFFTNESLCQAIQNAKNNKQNINFSFLLSGTRGDDGMVHSSWKHLVAFLTLLYEHFKMPPDKVRFLAILDGRDSPSSSSVSEDETGIGNYIGKLQTELRRYDAETSLAWVVGRNTAMDRDYQEHNAKNLWDLLINGKGQEVCGFDELFLKLHKCHNDLGLTDPEIPPIIVTNGKKQARSIQRGDTFINLNFRSDRQKSTTAMLIGDKNFLANESRSRDNLWDMNWLKTDLNLKYCCITEYDPSFGKSPNVSIAYARNPLDSSFLTAYSKLATTTGSKYLLVGESIKSAHVGYFLRGCREQPFNSEIEQRRIYPSFGASDNIHNDSAIYLKPAMQMPKIADYVVKTIESDNEDIKLIICNLAAPDMVGHLLPKRFDAAIEAYKQTENCVLKIGNSALAHGWHFIWSSDHGNIEEDSPSHTSNEVLTTIADPNNRLRFAGADSFRMRLFDISYLIANILGIQDSINTLTSEQHGWNYPEQIYLS